MCIRDSISGDEELCSSVTTILLQDPNSTEEVLQNRELDIYPNPGKGMITVSLSEVINGPVAIDLRSIDGRLLRSFRYDNFQQEGLDLSGYSAGVYLLQLRTEEGVTTRKLVLE